MTGSDVTKYETGFNDLNFELHHFLGDNHQVTMSLICAEVLSTSDQH